VEKSLRSQHEFDIYKSVHRNIIPYYSQQDANVHFSGGSSTHYQEHINVHTASGMYSYVLLMMGGGTT
jgi:hypothetical protein